MLVVDLNRDPNNTPLYDDGRIITSICPKKLLGESIYKDDSDLNDSEIHQRINDYFIPYHQKLDELIEKFKKADHSSVFIWDAHSIRRNVPSINEYPFPDLILGNNDYKSCEDKITELIFNNLTNQNLMFKLTNPEGGYVNCI